MSFWLNLCRNWSKVIGSRPSVAICLAKTWSQITFKWQILAASVWLQNLIQME